MKNEAENARADSRKLIDAIASGDENSAKRILRDILKSKTRDKIKEVLG